MGAMSLPAFYDVQKNEISSKRGSELRSYFVSTINAFQSLQKKAKFDELTMDLYDNGMCDSKDSKFCLLVCFSTEAEANIERKSEQFLTLARDLKSDDNDPLRLFYIILEGQSEKQSQLLVKLEKMLQAAGFTSGTGGGILLWRPKRRRFEKFGGDLKNAQDVTGFVRSVIDSGRSLGERHEEL